jgi:transposase
LARRDTQWHLALSDGTQRRLGTSAAGALVTLGAAMAKARARFGRHGGVPIVRGDEAGRAGCWRHRSVVPGGVAPVVVDAARIAVNRRARRAKTERVAVEPLLRLRLRSQHGEKRGWRVGRVPRGEAAEARRLPRACERRTQERPGHRHRLQALCVSQGGRLQPRHALRARWEAARLWAGAALPPARQAEGRRDQERRRAVAAQRRAVDAEPGRRLEAAGPPGQPHLAPWRPRRGRGLTSAGGFGMA